MTSAAQERVILIAALGDALEGLEEMIAYVPEHFREKWQHQSYIDAAREVLDMFDD